MILKKKYIPAFFLVVFVCQMSIGQSNVSLQNINGLVELEKEKKHLLDSLKSDFRSKVEELKQRSEAVCANSSLELIDELSLELKKEKKELKRSFKKDKKIIKKETLLRRKKIQEGLEEEIEIDKPMIASSSSHSIISEAEKHLGTPYKYGGNTKRGFDCSGFVEYVFNENNIDVPRVSGDQANAGKSVSVKDALPGDLLFFSHKGSGIDHVGIVVNSNGGKLEMIHASSSKGVIVSDVNSSDYWKKRLKKARRMN